MIIGVCGFIGSGKDTVADYLVNLHHFRRESFANTLKDAVSAVFGWDRTMLEGRTKQAREWREQVDPWWAERLDIPHLTPRWILQNWGTEVCRRGFHDDIKSIKKAGGIVVRVVRGPEPEWYDAAKSRNRGPNGNTNWALSGRRLEQLGVHASETAWVGTKFNAVLDNNGTLDDLYQQIMRLVQDHPPAR